ncbi:MAG: hypothetical protein K2G25_04690, partial [Oscillospiraceae bacterium]|nr:hypothetical protein [Oscillospiraceae bacterium]
YIAVTSKGIGKYEPVFDAFKLYGTITGTYPMGETEENEENSEISGDPGESDDFVMTGASADMQEIPAA